MLLPGNIKSRDINRAFLIVPERFFSHEWDEEPDGASKFLGPDVRRTDRERNRVVDEALARSAILVNVTELNAQDT